VDPRTVNHLRTGQRNRDLARALLAQPGLAPPPWEWVAVVAFYAAVHYVNAYLWEAARIAPVNHTQRRARVNATRAIRRCRHSYDRLQTAGYQARYDEEFALAEHVAGRLVTVELRAVEAAVMAALRLPAPTW